MHKKMIKHCVLLYFCVLVVTVTLSQSDQTSTFLAVKLCWGEFIVFPKCSVFSQHVLTIDCIINVLAIYFEGALLTSANC